MEQYFVHVYSIFFKTNNLNIIFVYILIEMMSIYRENVLKESFTLKKKKRESLFNTEVVTVNIHSRYTNCIEY